MTILHLINEFYQIALNHSLTVHNAHGDAGYVFWTQPKHGMSQALAVIHSHVTAWLGRR